MLKKSFIKHWTLMFTLMGMLLAGPANALDAGDWIVRFGVAHASPNDSSGTLSGAPTVGVAVDGDTQLFGNIAYMFTKNIGLELLASTPFEHTVSATGGLSGDIATVKQLPPTLSVQYYFTPDSDVRPYVGGGVNYTVFFDEKPTAVITSIELDSSVGLAVQAGVDIDFSNDWFANFDVRYIDMETTGTTNLGTVDITIDPWVFSAGVGLTF